MSFGNGGVAAAVAGAFGDIAVDSAGRILAVGATSPTVASPAGALSAGLLERFTSAGVLDSSFGAGGSKVVATRDRV